MKFEEVLPALREGKKIRREDTVWKNYYGFLFISETENKIFSDNVVNDNYRITKEDLKSDDWKIVQEKKKVKLRDLTEEQFKKYCNSLTENGKSGINCFKCIFHNVNCVHWDYGCWIKHKDLYSDKFLDQEIEIEEE